MKSYMAFLKKKNSIVRPWQNNQTNTNLGVMYFHLWGPYEPQNRQLMTILAHPASIVGGRLMYLMVEHDWTDICVPYPLEV